MKRRHVRLPAERGPSVCPRGHDPELSRLITDRRGRNVSVCRDCRQLASKTANKARAPKVGQIIRDSAGYVYEYQPDHPRAHKDGYIQVHVLIKRAS